MAYDIGARIGIDGEKAFRDSIAAINANIKAMGSELKAVTAQFSKNADSEEALAAKNEVLAKSITATKEKIGVLDKQLESQTDKLKSLGDELEAVTKAHGSDSEAALKAQNAYNRQVTVVAKLQSQLNGTKAELAGMENALEDNQKAMDGFGKEVEETVDVEEELRKGVSQISQTVKTLGSEMKMVSSSFAGSEKSIEAFAAKNQVLVKAISEQEQKLELLKRGLAESASKYGEAGAKTQKWQQDVYEATAELNRMEKELSDNEKAMDELEKETEEAGNALDDAGKSAVSFGDILKANIVSDLVVDGIRKLTDGLKEFVRFSLDSGMNFEAQMSRVEAIALSSITDAEQRAAEAEKLAEKAKEMGETTVFSATESAEALEYMAMAGWKTNDMLDGLAGIMNLAAASGESLASTSDIVTDAMTAFGLTAESSSHFADVLAVASSNANTNVGMMGETFKYVAPVAGALGYNIEDTAVAIGLMANSGIKASQAGTALRTTLTNMSKPTDDMIWAMEVLGVSLADEEGNMLSLMEIMDDLRSGFKGNSISAEEYAEGVKIANKAYADGIADAEHYAMALERLEIKRYGTTEAQQAKLAAMLAGKEAMSGLLAIVNASEEDYQKLTDAIYNAEGAAQEMADIMTDNLSGAMTLMGSAAEGVGISLYEKFQEPLTDVVRSITDEVLPAVQEFIDGMDTEEITANVTAFLEVMKMLIPVMTGAAAAMTAYKAASAISGLIDKLKLATEGQTIAQAALNAVMNANPFVLVATLIAGLATALVTAYMTSETFRNTVNAAFNSVTTTISNAVSKIKTFFTVTIPNAGRTAIDWFKSIPAQMKQVGQDLLTNLWSGIQDKVEWLKSKVRGIGESIKNIFTGGSSSSTASSSSTSRQAAAPTMLAAEEDLAPVLFRAARLDNGVSAIQDLQSAVASVGADLRASGALSRVRRDIDSAAASVASYYSAQAEARGNASGSAGFSGISAEDLAAAVRDALDGAKVVMDGRTVGRLTAVQQNNMGRAFGTA